MADEIQDKLNAMLSNPDLMRTLSALAGGFANTPMESSQPEQENISRDVGAELSSVVSSISDNNDSRINLLYALKPYMRSNRADQMDMAIKLLKLTKLTSLL